MNSMPTSTPTPAPTSHIKGLDFLKGIAILGVTLFHMFPQDVRGGYLGVSLFFVLTGYLLAYTGLHKAEAHHFSILNYFGKRLWRIYPSLLLVLLVTAGTMHFFLPNAALPSHMELASILLGFNNWWQIAQSADYFARITEASPFTHLWFLGIELEFYFIWPLLLFFGLWVRRTFGTFNMLLTFTWLALLTSSFMPLFYYAGCDITRLYYGTDTRIFALLFGVTLGFWRVHSQGSHTSLWKSILFWLSFLVIGVAYVFLDGQSDVLYLGGMLGVTLLFCLQTILVTNSAMALGSSTIFAPLRWLGRHSYGIFLWQYPVLFLIHSTNAVPMPWTPVAEGVAILLLTIWSDTLFGVLEEAYQSGVHFRWQGAFLYMPLLLCSLFGFFLVGGGAFSLVQADAQEQTSEKLRLDMQQKAAALAQENEAARKAQAEAQRQQAVANAEISGVACIGDSVMLGSSGELHKTLKNSYIDAEVSRYVGGGLEVAKQMQANGMLGNVVVIALGTNGPIAGYEKYESQTRALLAFLKDKQIFWVNVYCPKLSWQDTNNAYIQKMAQEHSNVTVVDWYGLISQHPDWLSKDGIHPNEQGVKAYAKLVHDAIANKLTVSQR